MTAASPTTSNPTHVYGTPGVFAAKVTVTDSSGATATKTMTITVTDAPGNGAPTVEEAYGLAGIGGNPMEVQFSARATDPDGDKLTLEWDFDDGSAKGSGTEVKHTYTTPGTYDAKVTAKDGVGGTHTFTVRVTVALAANLLPTVAVEADPRTGTAPLTVRFSSQASDPDGTDLKYTWAFGDGGGSAEPNPVHVYLGCRRVHGDADGRGSPWRPRFGVGAGHGHGRAGLARPGCEGAHAAPAQAPSFG